jgi:hypothetical protein
MISERMYGKQKRLTYLGLWQEEVGIDSREAVPSGVPI